MPGCAAPPPAAAGRRLTLPLLVALLAAAAAAPRAAAHGFISEPPSRNYLTNFQYCPHCLNGGGPGASSGGGTLVWPAHSQPACGTPALAAAGTPARRYAPGSGEALSQCLPAVVPAGWQGPDRATAEHWIAHPPTQPSPSAYL